jgi:hypothetical protein
MRGHLPAQTKFQLMQTIKQLIPLLFFCAVSSVSAQNLLADGRNLLQALEAMSDPSLSAEKRNEAGQQALIILFLYDEPTQITAPEQVQVDRVISHLQGNALLRDLVKTSQDSLFRLVTPPSSWQAAWDSIQTPSRESISTQLYGDAPRTAAEYLSVRRSMLESRLPPLQDAGAMSMAANKITKAPAASALLSQTEILETLFEFILQRAKQEVVESFFENLIDKKLPQVGMLFPNVRAQYNTPNYEYSQAFLASLRKAFFQDLQNLPMTLPDLFLTDDYFGELQEDPIFYNIMTVYSMYALSVQGDVPLAEIVPLTHRELYQRYQNAATNLNMELADSTASNSKEYLAMTDAASDFMQQVYLVWNNLASAERAVSKQVKSVKSAFPASRGNAPNPNNYLDKPLYDLQALLGNADKSSVFNLDLLPYLLKGSFETLPFQNYNTIADFDELFNPAHTPNELRLAGLQLTQNLTGAWYNDMGLVQILRHWQTDLASYENAVEGWRNKFDTLSVEQQLAGTFTQQQALETLIDQMRTYWTGKKLTSNDLLPLVQLGFVAQAGFSVTDIVARSPLDSLLGRRTKLHQIENRLIEFESRFGVAKADSPLQQYLKVEKRARLSDSIVDQIDVLARKLQVLRTSLNQLEATHAGQQKKVMHNVKPMLQITDLLSQLYYALQAKDGWIQKDSLKRALSDPKLRTACLGLLQQRLSGIRDLNSISAAAVAQFAVLTLEDIAQISAAEKDASSSEEQKSERLYDILTATLQTLNRALQLPLFASAEPPFTYVSLAELNPKLAPIPGISKQVMDFLYHLKVGEHRSAVASLLRVMTNLSDVINNDNTPVKRAKLLGFFQQYGDFIAGLVDAKTPAEMEYLLNSLADKPGSSRIKRTKSQSVSINSYLGASYGKDKWSREMPTETVQDNFKSFAPSIPIGISYSWLWGKKPQHKQSFTLHATILDLGSMVSFRADDGNDFGEEKVTFKNVLKPGIEFHWNIQRTPFYIGAGWRTGVQFRQDGDQEISFRSSRTFFAVGIDVPFRTIYQR